MTSRAQESAGWNFVLTPSPKTADMSNDIRGKKIFQVSVTCNWEEKTLSNLYCVVAEPLDYGLKVQLRVEGKIGNMILKYKKGETGIKEDKVNIDRYTGDLPMGRKAFWKRKAIKWLTSRERIPKVKG